MEKRPAAVALDVGTFRIAPFDEMVWFDRKRDGAAIFMVRRRESPTDHDETEALAPGTYRIRPCDDLRWFRRKPDGSLEFRVDRRGT